MKKRDTFGIDEKAALRGLLLRKPGSLMAVLVAKPRAVGRACQVTPIVLAKGTLRATRRRLRSVCSGFGS